MKRQNRNLVSDNFHTAFRLLYSLPMSLVGREKARALIVKVNKKINSLARPPDLVQAGLSLFQFINSFLQGFVLACSHLFQPVLYKNIRSQTNPFI